MVYFSFRWVKFMQQMFEKMLLSYEINWNGQYCLADQLKFKILILSLAKSTFSASSPWTEMSKPKTSIYRLPNWPQKCFATLEATNNFIATLLAHKSSSSTMNSVLRTVKGKRSNKKQTGKFINVTFIQYKK